MAIRKITFDDSMVSAKDDASLHHHIYSEQIGILDGIGDGCRYSVSNGVITFKSGYVLIYGRLIYVENGTSISVSLDSSKKGYVIIKVDTINNKATLELKEGTSSNYPTLTQTNLLEQDGIYEFALIGYSKTTTSLTMDSKVREYIDTYDNKLSELRTEVLMNLMDLKDMMEAKQHGMLCYFSGPTKQSGGLFTYDISIVTKEHSEGLLCFRAGGTFFSVPIPMLRSKTNFTFDYKYVGTWYQGTIEYSSGTIYIEVSNANHLFENIFYYY